MSKIILVSHQTAPKLETANTCELLLLGRQPFDTVWQLQRQLQSDLIAGSQRQVLILCEHDPVITSGRSAKPESLLISHQELERRKIKLYEIERGGDLTWHGPGQLVGYPILNLNWLKRDVHWYMRSLEEVLLLTLATFNIKGQRYQGRPGVWVPPPPASTKYEKIAAIGVRISRWCTMHGFALNVRDCSQDFTAIKPCGFDDIAITSMMSEAIKMGCPIPDFIDVQTATAAAFSSVFKLQLI